MKKHASNARPGPRERKPDVVEVDVFDVQCQDVPRMRKASVGAMLLGVLVFAAIPVLSSLRLSSGQADAAGIVAVILFGCSVAWALRWVHYRDVVVFQEEGFASKAHGVVRWDSLAAFEVRRFDWPPRVLLFLKAGGQIEFKASSVDRDHDPYVAFIERLLRAVERWNGQEPDGHAGIEERTARRMDKWLLAMAAAGAVVLAVMAVVAPRSLLVGAPALLAAIAALGMRRGWRAGARDPGKR